ncbi:unnamed protein product [Cuscuta epithymum]|uniref:Secreted protein n=1 Tax=Cuscuta epithymum TaxID=186058 RepID=A0AAV0F1Z4_9ASTE|nr:unnamed protein product [Cuscuta epithymum]CAH9129515.1 unnamed protein product [Cuscuta epithymum]
MTMSAQNDVLLVLVVMMSIFVKPQEACRLLVPRDDDYHLYLLPSLPWKPPTTPPPLNLDAATSPGYSGGVSFGDTMTNNKRRLLSPTLWKKNAAVKPTAASNSAPVGYEYLLLPSLQWRMPTPPGRSEEGNGH